jgi:hypothetical protein
MRSLLVTALTLLALVVDCAVGECSLSQTQINVTMCNWQGLRGTIPNVKSRSPHLLTQVATVLRNTLYLDGGQLWYQQYVMFQIDSSPR